MNTLKTIIFSFFSIMQVTLQAQSLSIQISNIGTEKGNIMIGVYDSASSFLTEDRVQSIMVPVTNKGTMTIELTGLAYGDYAISIFHDENANKKLDKNFLGIPKESYAFSNKAKARFGPPKYEQAQFSFDQNNQTVQLVLN